MVWTSGTTFGGQVEVLLLDGETGVVVETVPLAGLPNTGFLGFGLYGGAVDGEGNFWASQLGDASGGSPPGSLVRVRLSDLELSHWESPIPAYGMTVDGQGRPWLCAAETARFDPASELFSVGAGQPDGGSGCMEDGAGRLWIAGRYVTGIDLETMAVVAQYEVPVMGGNVDTGYTRGISIDDQGYIWAPAHWANRAYRLDPNSGEFEFVDGLAFPYTYSDMTGFALANAGVPAG
jgi:streptogramin lyase